MNSLVFALLAAASLSQTGRLAVPNDEARAYLAELYRDRAKITQGYVEYTLTTEKPDKRMPTMEGSIMTFHQWFGPGSRRLDIKEERPKDPDAALDLRCSYDDSDGTYRFIDRDRSNYSVREYTKAYLKGTEAPLSVISTDKFFDPRLLGVVGIDYQLMHHERLEDLKGIDPRAKTVVEHIQHGGKPARQIKVDYPDGPSSTYVVPDGSLLPVRIVTHSAKLDSAGRPFPPFHVEIDIEVDAMANDRGEKFDFPRLMKIRRVAEGQLEIAETILVAKANFNVPVDPSDLTWKALNPKVGVVLNLNGVAKISRMEAVTWDGEKFSLKPNYLNSFLSSEVEDVAPPMTTTSFRTVSQIVLIAGVFLAIALMTVKVFRRSSGKCA